MHRRTTKLLAQAGVLLAVAGLLGGCGGCWPGGWHGHHHYGGTGAATPTETRAAAIRNRLSETDRVDYHFLKENGATPANPYQEDNQP